jgi:hypothetical protein
VYFIGTQAATVSAQLHNDNAVHQLAKLLIVVLGICCQMQPRYLCLKSADKCTLECTVVSCMTLAGG